MKGNAASTLYSFVVPTIKAENCHQLSVGWPRVRPMGAMVGSRYSRMPWSGAMGWCEVQGGYLLTPPGILELCSTENLIIFPTLKSC